MQAATLSPRPQLSRLETIKRERSQARRLLFGIVVGIVVVLSVGTVFLLRASALQLTDITVTGTHVIVPEEVRTSADRFISGNFLWVLPKRSGLIYPKAELEAYLRETFPRIEHLTVDTVDRHTLAIAITERGSTYLWCAADDCYYADDKGLIFAKAPYFSGDIFFKFMTPIIGRSADELPIGGRVLAPDIFAHVVTLMRDIGSIGLEPAALESMQDGALAFVLETGDPALSAKLLFKGGDDPGTLFNNLRAALKTDALAGALTPGGLAKIDYLDLRFVKKVYFKLKK